MTRDEFRRRLEAASAEAAKLASDQVGRRIVAPVSFFVHVAGSATEAVSLDEAIDALYVGPELTHAVIDVGVVVRLDGYGTGWVVASGHEPRSDADVWDAKTLGPFKPVGAVW